MAHLSLRLPVLPALLALAAACGPVELPDDAEACAGVSCTAGECFSNAGQAMCRCGAWEAAADMPCHVAVFQQPDDHGSSPATATRLTLPMPVMEGHIGKGINERSKDRDLFVFTAESRHVYGLFCGLRTLPDCRMRLLDAAGNPAATSPEVDNSGRWHYATLEPGTWYVEVTSEENTGVYAYQVRDLGVDDHGNTRATATRLQDASALQVAHTGPYDVDAFLFRSRPGHGYRFICEQPPGPRDGRHWELWLTSAGGAELDSARGSFENPATVAVQTDVAADWLVELRVRGLPFPASSSCRFEDLGPDEHADVINGATPVQPGVPVRVTLQSEQDVDMLAFTGEAGHFYGLVTEQQGTWSAMALDASGRPLASGTLGNVFFKAQTAGTYYARINGGQLWNPSPWVRVVDLGPDDHGDLATDATPLAPGASVSGRFETASDVDTFTFTSAADGIYLASCEPACGLSFLQQGGMSLRSLNAGRALVATTRDAAVTLAARAADGAETFTLRLERVATDDHGDDEPGATALALPASMSGTAQTAVDVDAFVVTLEAGRTYQLGFAASGVLPTLTGPNGVGVNLRDGVFTTSLRGAYLLRISGAPGLDAVPWSFTLQQL